MESPEGKKFYGSVTVSERGQVVIPSAARKDFGIKTGDKLLVLEIWKRDLELPRSVSCREQWKVPWTYFMK